jgi:hypothetical protein
MISKSIDALNLEPHRGSVLRSRKYGWAMMMATFFGSDASAVPQRVSCDWSMTDQVAHVAQLSNMSNLMETHEK